MGRLPKNEVSGIWDQSEILNFHFFVHHHVEGPNLVSIFIKIGQAKTLKL